VMIVKEKTESLGETDQTMNFVKIGVSIVAAILLIRWMIKD